MQDTNETGMLHGDETAAGIQANIRRILVAFAIFLAVGLVLVAGSLIWRDATHMHNANETPSQILTIAITLVWGCVLIFLWGMKMTPLLGYRRYLKEVHSGLSREVEGAVTEVEPDMTFREGLRFYRMIVNVGDLADPEDERLLYWDAQLGAPPVQAGDQVWLRAHGNDIIALTKR